MDRETDSRTDRITTPKTALALLRHALKNSTFLFNLFYRVAQKK